MNSKKEQLRAAFNAAYAALNAAQKKAVDTIEGPVMVIAGPGTGKTQILTLRIANILLKTDTTPESILALTFTESGAKAMRDRLHRYIGSDAYKVPIFTFHGFAERLIRDYPDAFLKVIGGRPANEIEKIHIIESILDGGEIKKLRPSGNPSYYVMHILRIISQLKQEYINPDSLAKLIDSQESNLGEVEQYHQKGAHKGKVRGEYTKLVESIEKNRELLFIYRQYEALMSESHIYDFEDMISEAVTALSQNESMLRDLQERYQYVLADEHQDVNGSQNRILELLSSYHTQPNIFVVGDEKQAIYRFQGASLDNFLFFQDHYQDTTVIQLTDNYRSGQAILDSAHSLVAVDEGPLRDLRVALKAAAVKDSVVTQKVFPHQAVEDNVVVKSVSALIAEGVCPTDIAVIVRTNREVEAYASLLRKEDLPVMASADSDILNHPIIQAVETLLEAVVTNNNEYALFKLLHGPYWKLDASDIVKITAARNYDTSLVSILSDRAKLESLNVSKIEEALKINGVIGAARAQEMTEPPHRVLQYLITASGFLNQVMNQDPIEGVRVLRRLYDEVEALVLADSVSTLQGLVDYLGTQRSYGIALNAPYINANKEAIQVMTAHKSKGLEFEIVFIPHLQDSLWGGNNKRTYFNIPLNRVLRDDVVDIIDDERRLLYVAMTRAKTSLNLSYSESSSDGKVLTPSRLYDELDESLLTVRNTTADQKEFSLTPPMTFDVVSSIDKSLLCNVLETRGFSATSLNNYLKNPWDYLYRNVLRVPEVQPTHMQFGTAIHSVLEHVTKTHSKTGKFLTANEVKSLLESALGRLPLSVVEFTHLHEKGLEVLYSYINHIKNTLPSNTKEELNLRVLLSTGIAKLPELPLTGKLDRIDIGSDGLAIRVVDYKTGKPKTRNVIEGKTANSDGGYKRQLVFYALLLSLYDDERYKTKEGVLSFVEADSKGQIHEETFLITDEEIESLRTEIIAAAESIIEGDFLADAEALEDSEYKDLARYFISK